VESRKECVESFEERSAKCSKIFCGDGFGGNEPKQRQIVCIGHDVDRKIKLLKYDKLNQN